ncbi:MAG TPA: hypothetical protein VF846_12445 [Thermoanaerobaculia bacterium]|jgi:hypothetical protein
MRRVLLTILLVALITPARAEHRRDADFERVLVPVFFSGPGAFGAQWATTIALMNTGPAIDLAVPVVGERETICPAVECLCNSEKRLPERNVETVCRENEHPSGMILYVPRRTERDDVHVGARVLDTSRTNDRYGTAIPVVWERDLLDSPMVLLDIPTDRRYRTSLRLYDVFQWNTPFSVRFFDSAAARRGNATPLLETTVTAAWDPDPENSQRFPMRPAFAFIGDIVAAYPQLAAVESVTIEIIGSHMPISPPQPDRRFYALASITNNRTQEITIVAPR